MLSTVKLSVVFSGTLLLSQVPFIPVSADHSPESVSWFNCPLNRNLPRGVSMWILRALFFGQHVLFVSCCWFDLFRLGG
jgi:hypothetical protein